MSSRVHDLHAATRCLVRSRARRTAVAILTVLLPCGLASCGQSDGQANASENGIDGKEFVRIINVEVSSLTPMSFSEYIRLTGTVKAKNDVTLSAEEPGRVTKVLVEKGRSVKPGQALLRIDDRLLRAQIAQAEAESTLAHEAFERQAAVWQNKIGTELAYLERKNALATAAARLQALRVRLENTVIRAPFAGVLDARYIEEDEMAAPSQRVVRVINADKLEIIVGVPERFAADVRQNTRAIVTFDVLPEREFEGSVSFVGRAVNRDNRTFPVEILLDNPEGIIKPEMIANVRVVRSELDAAIVVPQQSLRYTENGYVAYIAVDGEQGTIAEERRVEVGPAYANRIVVEKGLNTGDRLITNGHLLVAPGSRVEIVPSKERAQR